eukprot:Rhum_TRINITY_DN14841_c15_g1::Rhum_TRINITY_DN14841_c15_g1_i1::g.122488::m.122488
MLFFLFICFVCLFVCFLSHTTGGGGGSFICGYIDKLFFYCCTCAHVCLHLLLLVQLLGVLVADRLRLLRLRREEEDKHNKQDEAEDGADDDDRDRVLRQVVVAVVRLGRHRRVDEAARVDVAHLHHGVALRARQRVAVAGLGQDRRDVRERLLAAEDGADAGRRRVREPQGGVRVGQQHRLVQGLRGAARGVGGEAGTLVGRLEPVHLGAETLVEGVRGGGRGQEVGQGQGHLSLAHEGDEAVRAELGHGRRVAEHLRQQCLHGQLLGRVERADPRRQGRRRDRQLESEAHRELAVRGGGAHGHTGDRVRVGRLRAVAPVAERRVQVAAGAGVAVGLALGVVVTPVELEVRRQLTHRLLLGRRDARTGHTVRETLLPAAVAVVRARALVRGHRHARRHDLDALVHEGRGHRGLRRLEVPEGALGNLAGVRRVVVGQLQGVVVGVEGKGHLGGRVALHEEVLTLRDEAVEVEVVLRHGERRLVGSAGERRAVVVDQAVLDLSLRHQHVLVLVALARQLQPSCEAGRARERAVAERGLRQHDRLTELLLVRGLQRDGLLRRGRDRLSVREREGALLQEHLVRDRHKHLVRGLEVARRARERGVRDVALRVAGDVGVDGILRRLAGRVEDVRPRGARRLADAVQLHADHHALRSRVAQLHAHVAHPPCAVVRRAHARVGHAPRRAVSVGAAVRVLAAPRLPCGDSVALHLNARHRRRRQHDRSKGLHRLSVDQVGCNEVQIL